MILTVTVKGTPPPTGDEFLARWTDITARRMRKDVLEPVASLARQYAPSDQGIYKQTIGASVTVVRPGLIVGSVYSTDERLKAQVIEGVDERGNRLPFGRKPGSRFPPVINMLMYARHRTGLTPGPELNRVAYLFGRKIAMKGILPKRPIGNAVDQLRNLIGDSLRQGVWSDMGRRI